MFKVAIAMVAFASCVSAQEVCFAPPEYFFEETLQEELAAAEEAVLEAQDSDELVLLEELEDEIISETEEEVSAE